MTRFLVKQLRQHFGPNMRSKFGQEFDHIFYKKSLHEIPAKLRDKDRQNWGKILHICCARFGDQNSTNFSYIFLPSLGPTFGPKSGQTWRQILTIFGQNFRANKSGKVSGHSDHIFQQSFSGDKALKLIVFTKNL